MAREFGRSARVSSQIQKELAFVLQQGVKDPRLGFITVNEVIVSKDLAVAKAYVTVLNADKREIQTNIEILNEAAAYFRNEVGKRMKMRMTPELRFYYDDSMDTGLRVDQLLKGLTDDSAADDPEG